MDNNTENETLKEFLQLCFSRSILKRAGITAFIVGTILIFINHGDAIVQGTVDLNRLLKMILTMFVPYLVSTISSVSTILSIKKGAGSNG